MFHRGAIALAALSLVMVGCGGSDDDGADAAASSEAADDASTTATQAPTVTTAPTETQPAASDEPEVTEAPAATVPPAGDDAGSDGGANVATISVADQTFEFEWEADAVQRCDTDFFGGFWGLAQSLDGQPGFNAELWREGTGEGRPSRIEVSDGADGSWSADPEGGVGAAAATWPGAVDTVEFDGNTATGTATFVAEYDYSDVPETFSGTFTITCG
jgi:hypothetical protein